MGRGFHLGLGFPQNFRKLIICFILSSLKPPEEHKISWGSIPSPRCMTPHATPSDRAM